jgi:ATP-binding cassette subfamily C protein
MLALRFIKLLWNYAPQRTALVFVLSLISAVGEGIGLMLLVPILGVMQSGMDQIDGPLSTILQPLSTFGFDGSLTWFLILFIVLIIIRSIVSYASTVLSSGLQFAFLDQYKLDCFRAVVRAKWHWSVQTRASDHANILINEIGRIGFGVSQSYRFLTSTILLCSYLIVAAFLSLPMTILSLCVGVITVFLLRRQHRAARYLGDEETDISNSVQQVIQEGLAGIKLTKILGNEQRHGNVLDGYLTAQRKNVLDFVKLTAGNSAIYQVLVAVMLVSLVWVGIVILELPIATLLIMIVIFSRMAPMMRSLQTQTNDILHASAALKNVQKTMQLAGENEEAVHADDGPSIQLTKALVLKDVSFNYQGVKTLNGINLTIAANKTTAIMGPSGGGKSTLADVIMGLLTPSMGKILVDDIPLNDDNIMGWRRGIAYVSQDIFMFHDTIRANLLWAKDDATDGEIKAALEQSAAHFVYDLADGLETVVGDGGIRLSGGERQRIALARAMLQSPEILILDEATSALDVENERKIIDAIRNLHGKMTVIVIGHRLPTLEHADQIVVIEAGKVAKKQSVTAH